MDGMAHGTGMVRYLEGGTYIGEFVKDEQSGHGTRIKGTAVFSGEFRSDYPRGNVSCSRSDGDTYQGELKKG